MSRLFLLNEAIDTNDIDLFKDGMYELIKIEKNPTHSFLKHETIYNLSILTTHIYPNMHGQKEQEIFRFLEQLSPYQEEYVDDEIKANNHCGSGFNGFLGFIFPTRTIPDSKQVNNNSKYKQWCFQHSPDKKYLLDTTDILSKNKESHFADHHGKDELKRFWDSLKNCPYVEKARSTNFGGHDFIRSINDDGTIEIVLLKTQRKYAIHVHTTGKDLLETKAIADIIEQEYNR